MGVTDQKRLLSWLSQLDEAEPVVLQGDNKPSARFNFDGIPIEKQTLPSQKLSPQARRRQKTNLELEGFQQPHSVARLTAKGADAGITRKEKNGYERIPRAKTKEDRYECKGKGLRGKDNRSTAAQKKKPRRQKRKHTINEDFHASNVPSNRLTLHSATNLGIFTRGKRSSPVKTRVLDHGFSETEFLNRASVPEQANQSFQPRNSISILKYDIEIGSTSQARNEAGVKLLRSSVEGAPQQQPPSGNMELDQTDTAIYHESENDPNPREDTVTAPLSQLFPRGEERGGSHERLTVRSQAGQDVCSVVNLPGEYGTMQQLDFHLHSPKESVTIGPARKYWTLDELKNLMQQRISSWKSKAEDNMMTLAPQLQQSSRKRKRTSSQEGEASHTELPKKSRIRGQGQRLDIKRTGKSTSPRISILDSCSLPVGCIDFPLGKPLSAHGQIYHAIEGNEFQPQRPCRDRGAILFCDEDTSFVSQAFDAAYEVIMRSERDAPLDLSDVVSMRRESTGNNEGGISMQAPWEWGSEDEEPMLNSSRIGKEMLLSSRKDRGPAFDTTGGRYYDQQHTYIGGLYINREPLLTIEENSTTELRQALGRKGPEANRLNLDVGPMKNFWRQNKLY